LGEDTKELLDGQVVSTEGSREAGVDNARAGIFMPATPQVGQAFKQEDANKVAEDCSKIVDLNTSVKTGFVSSNQALKTEEFSLLEPGGARQQVLRSGHRLGPRADRAGRRRLPGACFGDHALTCRLARRHAPAPRALPGRVGCSLLEHAVRSTRAAWVPPNLPKEAKRRLTVRCELREPGLARRLVVDPW
jgi:hypothetical protein